ncbi:MAG: aspartate--tRNA ligase [Gemmatimonadota bacterium]
MTHPLSTRLRTDGAGTLRAAHVGRAVALCGWIHRRRDHGGLVFLDLRDRYGIVQCVANPERLDSATFAAVEKFRAEDVVRVEGTVASRPEASVNEAMATGGIEVEITACALLAEAATPPFPIDVEKEGGEVAEDLRLRYRYLELRRPRLTAALGMRHRIAWEARRYLDGLGFWEIETPMLTRPTPEGARDYLVPSRVHPGKFYALPQSPQLYKQLLMVAGYDRYFQIARCFRDEDLRADRQPEFTQIDMEMAFVDTDDVIEVVSGLFRHLFRACLEVQVGEIPRLSHDEALTRFGSDKPDLRIEHELVDLTDHFRASGFRIFDGVVESGGRIVGLMVPGAAVASRSQLDRWTEIAQGAGARGLVWARRDDQGWSSSIDKFVASERWAVAGAAAGAGPGDLLLAVAGPPRTARLALGALRVHLARERGWIDEGAWRPLWIVDFPLFEEDPQGDIVPSHHPFTAPVGGLEGLAALDPLSIKAQAYDFVIDGYEIGSGSIRIHQRAVQEALFRRLGISPEEARARFGFLLSAFEHGAPPHGGFAVGFDRTAMLFAGGDSLRDVIAFPKTTSANALLEGAPAIPDPQELADLHIRVVAPDTGLTAPSGRR